VNSSEASGIIKANCARVFGDIATTSRKSGREGRDITLVAVTKFHPVDQILPLAACGINAIGESRIQELQGKFDSLYGKYKIHFIGHLQTNKAKLAVKMADLIHSVDSEKLAAAVNSAALSIGKVQEILLQVNCSNEIQKGGIEPANFSSVLHSVSGMKGLKVKGLMTMAALTEDRDEIRSSFRLLKEIRDNALSNLPDGVELSELSMGMSHDFDIAIEEGATMVRIGSALFSGVEDKNVA
jgi:pyridoxal phosphate enzyme (YggS family)